MPIADWSARAKGFQFLKRTNDFSLKVASTWRIKGSLIGKKSSFYSALFLSERSIENGRSRSRDDSICHSRVEWSLLLL